MDRIRELESQAFSTIRKIVSSKSRIPVLWNGDKSSTILVWMLKKICEKPLIIWLDTKKEFSMLEGYRYNLKNLWNMELIISSREEEVYRNVSPNKCRKTCCNELIKINLEKAINKHAFDTVIVPEDHSWIDNDFIRPLKEWSDIDIWQYAKINKIPLSKLHFSIDGKRYETIKCEPCSEATKADVWMIDQIIYQLKKEIPNMGEQIASKLKSLGYL